MPALCSMSSARCVQAKGPGKGSFPCLFFRFKTQNMTVEKLEIQKSEMIIIFKLKSPTILQPELMTVRTF